MEFQEQLDSLAATLSRIVKESGNPTQFDAHAWLTRWLNEPVPALGGRKPREVLAEPGGLERIRNLLMRMQSGAYS